MLQFWIKDKRMNINKEPVKLTFDAEKLLRYN